MKKNADVDIDDSGNGRLYHFTSKCLLVGTAPRFQPKI